MAELLRVVVPGQPQPKQRPRLGRGGHTFTPQKTRHAEGVIRTYCHQAMAGRPPFTGPLKLAMAFKRSDRRRVDLDNLCKIVDAINGVVWEDDHQILELHATLERGCDEGSTTIVVSELDA